MFIDNHDWMGEPSIAERFVEDISHLEGGGVAYTNYRNAGDGSFAAMMGAAPGTVPAYRGSNQKISGLALTNQNQLNTVLGNVFESRNSKYPEVMLDLVGNFRNLDVAPQEVVTLTVLDSDTNRGISWEQKAFTPRAMSWSYDAGKGLFLPSVTLAEVTQGNAGQTISIPAEPPSGGFDQPPIPLPPPVPPITGGGGGMEFFDVARGVNDTDITYINYTVGLFPNGWVAPANKSSYMEGFVVTRTGYVGTITIYIACYIYTTKQTVFNSTGNRWEIQAGEFVSQTSFSEGNTIHNSGGSGWYNVAPYSFSSNGETWGLRMKSWRSGLHASDTNNTNVGFHGWWVVYS
jgi:hypothetical protein